MRSSLRSRRPVRVLSAFAALTGVLLMSSGVALMATAPAHATTPAEGCVASPEKVESSGWVTSSPGAGWVKVDQRTKAGTGTADEYKLQWFNFNGPWKSDSAPPLDDDGWHAVPGNPDGPNGDPHQQTPGVPYNVAHNDNGNGSWFVYKNVKVKDGVPAVIEYLFSKTTPAVVCDPNPPATATYDATAPQACDALGSFSVTGDHLASTVPAAGAHAPGTFDVVAHAVSGYLFDNGQATKTISVTVPAYDGTCGDDTEGPELAEATVQTAAPQACDALGSFTVTGTNLLSTVPASGAHAAGTFDVVLHAVDGALFDNELPTKTISVTIPSFDGTCAVDGPSAATATPQVTAPTGCGLLGSFTVSGENLLSTSPASGAHAAGTFVVTATAVAGHVFDNEQSTKELTVTIPAYDGTCEVVETPETTPQAGTPVTPTSTTPKTVKTTKKPATTPVIPTVVHAGLGTSAADLAGLRSERGLALLVAGALVLLAGGIGMTRQRGVHVRS